MFYDVWRCINPLTCKSNQHCSSSAQGFKFPESFPSDLATWEREVLLRLLSPVLLESVCLSKQRQRKGHPQRGSRDRALMSLPDYGLWVHLRWGVIRNHIKLIGSCVFQNWVLATTKINPDLYTFSQNHEV